MIKWKKVGDCVHSYCLPKFANRSYTVKENSLIFADKFIMLFFKP